jgi:hypothetical protein
MNASRMNCTTIFASLKMSLCLLALLPLPGQGQAWRNCIPDSIGPGGCDSIGPGGGQSIGPGGGQSIGPGGGLSIGPGGGLAIDRDRSRGLDTRTMRPFPPADRVYRP